MPADKRGLEFYSSQVFIPKNLLSLACEVFSLANLHPMTRDKAAVLRLSGQDKPIAGRFVEVAGTDADINGLSEILADLGLPPDLFAPVCWGTLARLSPPTKNLDTPWSLDF